MPGRSVTVGERLSRIEATVDAHAQYERERWHKQDNDLQLLMALPERLARERGEDRGQAEGRINSVVKDLERAITDAVEKAVAPLAAKQADHDQRLDTLEAQRNMLTGAKLLIIFLVQTFIAAMTALAGAFEFTRGHP